MAAVNQETVDRIDRILTYVGESAPLISDAHERFGIPVDELICAAVNRAASLHVVDAHQPELFGIGNGDSVEPKK